MAQASAQIGVTGLGVMGRNLARNFARHGYTVALHNRTASRTTGIAAQFGHEGALVPARSAAEFVRALQRPRRLVVMVSAGAATDAVIGEFAPLLEPGDVVIDGGNAHFADTRRREAALRRAHLPPHRPRRHLPHPMGTRPIRSNPLSTERRSCYQQQGNRAWIQESPSGTGFPLSPVAALASASPAEASAASATVAPAGVTERASN